jgi:hypothetical protein
MWGVFDNVAQQDLAPTEMRGFFPTIRYRIVEAIDTL